MTAAPIVPAASPAIPAHGVVRFQNIGQDERGEQRRVEEREQQLM
jgi:hypothetical protein